MISSSLGLWLSSGHCMWSCEQLTQQSTGRDTWLSPGIMRDQEFSVRLTESAIDWSLHVTFCTQAWLWLSTSPSPSNEIILAFKSFLPWSPLLSLCVYLLIFVATVFSVDLVVSCDYLSTAMNWTEPCEILKYLGLCQTIMMVQGMHTATYELKLFDLI